MDVCDRCGGGDEGLDLVDSCFGFGQCAGREVDALGVVFGQLQDCLFA